MHERDALSGIEASDLNDDLRAALLEDRGASGSR
jgi:hypothetical protein